VRIGREIEILEGIPITIVASSAPGHGQKHRKMEEFLLGSIKDLETWLPNFCATCSDIERLAKAMEVLYWKAKRQPTIRYSRGLKPSLIERAELYFSLWPKVEPTLNLSYLYYDLLFASPEKQSESLLKLSHWMQREEIEGHGQIMESLRHKVSWREKLLPLLDVDQLLADLPGAYQDQILIEASKRNSQLAQELLENTATSEERLEADLLKLLANQKELTRAQLRIDRSRYHPGHLSQRGLLFQLVSSQNLRNIRVGIRFYQSLPDLRFENERILFLLLDSETFRHASAAEAAWVGETLTKNETHLLPFVKKYQPSPLWHFLFKRFIRHSLIENRVDILVALHEQGVAPEVLAPLKDSLLNDFKFRRDFQAGWLEKPLLRTLFIEAAKKPGFLEKVSPAIVADAHISDQEALSILRLRFGISSERRLSVAKRLLQPDVLDFCKNLSSQVPLFGYIYSVQNRPLLRTTLLARRLSPCKATIENLLSEGVKR
jgi:hypothetical protein